MAVAVGHVRTEQEHCVIQKSAFAVLDRRQLAEELREAVHVPRLNLYEFFDPREDVRVMRHSVERIRDADVVVRSVRSFRRHHERYDTRNIRPIRDGDHIEQEFDLLVESVQWAFRHGRKLRAAEIACEQGALFEALLH